MNRRQFLSFAAGTAGGLLSVSRCMARADTKPNIVYILADDMGYGDPQCYNPRSRIPTPNIDRLAAEGMRFTDAHTPSAVCTPTRYSILTGRYCWRTWLKEGVLDGFDPPLIEEGRLTVPGLLKRHGYATCCIGKWHLGMGWTDRDGRPVPRRSGTSGGFRPGEDVDYARPSTSGPTARGFDHFFGISASLDMSPYCFIENDRTVGIPNVPTRKDMSLFMNQAPGMRTEDFRLEDVLPACTRKAVEYIENRAKTRPDRPFFLYLPLPAPHLPIVPTEEFAGRSKAGLYGDFVVQVDAAIGVVLDALAGAGLAENTLVIFTSDNGGLWHWWDFREADDVAHGRISARGRHIQQYGHQSNAHLRGTKADIWEGGHRVPFIARWPARIEAGGVSDELVCLTDLLATCADLLNERLPDDAGEDSVSILPILLGKATGKPVREAVICQALREVFAIRQGDWKLILGRGSGGFSSPRTVEIEEGEPAGQLYNLKEDPAETRNLHAERPDIVRQLTELFDRCVREGHSRPKRQTAP